MSRLAFSTLRQSAARLSKQSLNVTSKRSFAVNAAALPSLTKSASRVISKAAAVQTRGMKTLDFGGTKEVVYERTDFPPKKLLKTFENDTLAMIGYGPQGRGQALNARDQGLKIIVGVRKDGDSWNAALEDGWVPGKDLFPIEDACAKGSIIMYLLSDAAQKTLWPTVKPYLTKGKTLCFSHGFSVVYKEDTQVIPPKDIDVVLVAPKGSGYTVRSLFQQGRGINASVAVHQDFTGKAKERVVALGVAVGTGYTYETTFEKEVYSDLTGERGVLMGAINGLFLAQYEVLRANGHSPSEAFNETVEEATQSLYPLIGQNGMDWMYANCSTTAQRGALDWFKPFHKATKPVFEELYAKVRDGSETRRSLTKNSSPTYRKELEAELAEIRNHEMWRAGATVRGLRPENVKNHADATVTDVDEQKQRAVGN